MPIISFWIYLWRALFLCKFENNFADFSPSSHHVNFLHTFASSSNVSYIYSSSDLILLCFWSLSYSFKSFSRSFDLFSRSFFIFLLFQARILEYDIVDFRLSSFIYSNFTWSSKEFSKSKSSFFRNLLFNVGPTFQTSDQLCFNVVDKHWNNVDPTLKMKQNLTSDFQRCTTLIQRRNKVGTTLIQRCFNLALTSVKATLNPIDDYGFANR